jgi:uncharacterized cupredoxin-like copper-binding protein
LTDPPSMSFAAGHETVGDMSASGDRKVLGLGTWIFSLVALILAFSALALAAQARSRSDDAKDAVHKLAAGGLLGDQMRVRLQEFSMVARPASVKAGAVRFTIHNAGTMTHEMVLARAPSAAALPLVTVAGGERAVGAIDEEAIPETDLPGEAEVKTGQTVTKTIRLTPGVYVMFCNIDNKQPDGSVLNHFQRGMSSVFTVS